MITNQPSDAIKQANAYKLFFALWPDDATRAALARLQPLVRGRQIPVAKLHLTLAFLGQQPASAMGALMGILDGLVVPDMVLMVDSLGYFTRPRIAWAGMTAPPEALGVMQAALMAQLEAAGFPAATHGEFKPHITLAREAQAPMEGTRFEPVRWRASDIALVESRADGTYVPLATPRHSRAGGNPYTA